MDPEGTPPPAGEGTPPPAGEGTPPAPAGREGLIPPPAGEANPFLDFIPESHRDKGWAKDIKDPNGFFDQFDHMKSVIGGLPAKSPETADLYNFAAPAEGAPPVNEAFQSVMRQAAFDNKLNQEQLTGIETVFDTFNNALITEASAAEETRNAEFDTLANTHLGEGKVTKIAQVQALLKGRLSPELAAFAGDMDNKSLVMMASLVHGIATEFMGEDNLPSVNDSGSMGNTNEGKQEEGKKLMLSKEFNDPMHPNHQETVDKVNALYQSLTPKRT